MGNADWVSNRHGCTIDRLFDELREGALECVDERNDQTAGGNLTFRVHGPLRETPHFFFVELAERDMMDRQLRVRFMKNTGRITIEGSNGVDTRLIVAVDINELTSERRIILRRGEEVAFEAPLWRVLRESLENLFFDVAVN